jgi:signal transduction histidine kinase
MSPLLRDMEEEYSRALQEYCANGSEEALLRGYQLGRRAVSEGMGVLQIAALHQEALGSSMVGTLAAADSRGTAKRAAEFLGETLAPFELSRHGFQQINATLSDLNKALQNRLDAALQAFEAVQGELLERRRVEQLKDEFISIISHELRTPLTSIHGALNLLKTGLGGELNLQGQQLLDVAYRNSQRLVRLVTEILDLQKIEAGAMTFNMQPIELGPFLTQALAASEGFACKYDVPLALARVPRRAFVRADPDRLMQVMDNLLSNAVKFSPPETPVTVEGERRMGTIRVSIQDRGPGVPEEFRTRIFERFAQAAGPGARNGCGLGLSISKAIVEHLGGRLGFESQEGQGAAFFFDLPEWSPAQTASEEGAECRDQV